MPEVWLAGDNAGLSTSPSAMEIISSRQNTQIKQLCKLTESARERRKAGQAVLEGIHLIAAWHEAARGFDLLLAAESALAHGEIAPLWRDAAAQRKLVVSDSLFAQLAEISAPVGILAIVDVPRPALSRHDCIVLLDEVQDPLNVGGILRTAAAAGAGAVYLSAGCADAWSPKVLRGGMGGHLALDIHEHADLAQVVRDFQGQVAVTTLQHSQSLYDADLHGATAFVFGNEGAGVRDELLALASLRLRIPMPGKVESLNVAAAAAVCLFERVRQLGARSQFQ